MLERARAVAAAELDLCRVRQAKVALMEHARALGALSPEGGDQSGEVMQRVLPELLRLDRYERRAAARRERAARDLTTKMILLKVV